MNKFTMLLIPLLIVGCATTPNSIKSASATSIAISKAQDKDTEMIVNKYDNELNHWIDVSYQNVMEETEKSLVDSNGKVDLEQYKAAVEQITTKMATVKAEYAKDKEDILSAVKEKAEKQLLLQMLIDQYERETGVAPETIDQLVSVLGDSAKGIMEVYDKRKAEKAAADAAKGPSLKDKLNTMTDDLFDQVFAQMQTKMKEQK